MKPTETITLIDLEGKHITVIGPEKLEFSEYARIAQIEYRYLEPCYQVYIGRYLIVSEETEDYEEALKLALSLNDQLTFIRNEMWESLTTYQATLGRYWEVPWYDVTSIWKELEPLMLGKLHEIFPRMMYTPYDKMQRPSLDEFLKHYADVFSKLTPWKGE